MVGVWRRRLLVGAASARSSAFMLAFYGWRFAVGVYVGFSIAFADRRLPSAFAVVCRQRLWSRRFKVGVYGRRLSSAFSSGVYKVSVRRRRL
jgi:hypothetical protein